MLLSSHDFLGAMSGNGTVTDMCYSDKVRFMVTGISAVMLICKLCYGYICHVMLIA